MKSLIIRKQNVVKYEKQKILTARLRYRIMNPLDNKILISFRILSHKIQILFKQHFSIKFDIDSIIKDELKLLMYRETNFSAILEM